jgi:hypothetical protein
MEEGQKGSSNSGNRCLATCTERQRIKPDNLILFVFLSLGLPSVPVNGPSE